MQKRVRNFSMNPGTGKLQVAGIDNGTQNSGVQHFTSDIVSQRHHQAFHFESESGEAIPASISQLTFTCAAEVFTEGRVNIICRV